MTTTPIRLGISRCLLGDHVRFDGGHRRDTFVTEILGRYVEWVPVCPEVEAGLGTPREAMQLVGNPLRPRLMTITTKHDHTPALEAMTEHRLEGLKTLDLSGFIFKSRSPSCGVERVRVYNRNGISTQRGAGIFANAFIQQFPLVPVEEEGRLCDPAVRESFIERVFCYNRLQQFVQNGVTKQALIRFHTLHKYVLLTHSQQHYETMEHLIGQTKRYHLKELTVKYSEHFMRALTLKTTVRKHVTVLRHIVGSFKNRLSTPEKTELLGVVTNYRRGLIPLIVPLTLIKHYVKVFDVTSIREQVYLNPHPKELMLRNHV